MTIKGQRSSQLTNGRSPPPVKIKPPVKTPRPSHVSWSSVSVFESSDADEILRMAARPLRRGARVENLLKQMNRAVEECIAWARLTAEAGPTELEDWSMRVSESASDLLSALGVEVTPLPPILLPEGVEEALFPGEMAGEAFASKLGGNIPSSVEAVRACWHLYDWARRAAVLHGSRIKPTGKNSEREMSPRQVFLLYLARAYQDCFAYEVPKGPGETNPFTVFAVWSHNFFVARLKADLMQGAKEGPRRPQYGALVLENDGSHCIIEGYRFANIDSGQLRDEMRRNVHKLINPRRIKGHRSIHD